VLVLPSRLTAREARDTQRLLVQALGREAPGEAVVVDAGPLAELDSAALAVLLEVQRRARAERRAFRVQSAPPKLRALATLYGVDAILLPAA
jgi:phospholipid transport system transporter-binding protein